MLDEQSPLEEMVDTCKDWSNDTLVMLRQRAPKHSGRLKKSLRTKLKLRKYLKSEVEAIVFVYERYGIWQEKGAGTGAGGQKGSKWYRKNKDGSEKLVRTNKESLGKMGIKRRQNLWIESVILSRLELLSDILGREIGRSIVKYLRG